MSYAILNTKTDDCRDAAYIARPSPLGNPYAIGPDGDRDAVIERYRGWLTARIAERDPVVCTALLGIRPGQPLSCHCAPARCHGEVIADTLDGGVQEMLKSIYRKKSGMKVECKINAPRGIGGVLTFLIDYIIIMYWLRPTLRVAYLVRRPGRGASRV